MKNIGKTVITGITTVFTAVLMSACDNRATETLSIAGQNQTELLKVIDHYAKTGDTQKQEAAMFLVKNMKEHYYMESVATDSFMTRVRRLKTDVEADSLSRLWDEVKRYDKPKMKLDAKNVSYELLVNNIDRAVERWRQSAWKKEVDFNTFCKYILPHRMLTEMPANGWRDTLYNEYHPLIEGVRDMKTAFRIVHDAVSERFKRTPFGMPYIMDIPNLRRIGRGSCVQHCVYEAAVMRALALPAAVDGIDAWANYSKNGHMWVALVTGDGTYTMAKKDTLARKMNYIDSSIFEMKNKPEEDYPYSTDFRKRCCKVIRSTYEYNDNEYDDGEADKMTHSIFEDPYKTDVTQEYMKCHDVKVSSDVKAEYGYLCTFKTGAGWIPAVFAKQTDGQFTFRDMADSVVYLPVFSKKGELFPICNPFALINGEKHYITPQHNTKISMTLNRKYPLTAHFISYWPPMRGARFEAANSSDFTGADVLYTVQRTPLLINEVTVNSNKKYRYVRYVSPEEKNPGISELQFSYKGKRINGTPWGDTTLNNKTWAFDGDYLTVTEAHVPFIFGLDFGKPVSIDRLMFSPKTDANFIIPGNKYELFYYDMGWKSLGIKTATGYSVSYSGVPANALYILRNRTAGDEERIFEYINRRQIWW